MIKGYLTTAVAMSLLLGSTLMATGAYYKYDSMCAMGLAKGKTIQTGCKISEVISDKTYCFASEAARAEFMKAPEPNIAKAEKFYQTLE